MRLSRRRARAVVIDGQQETRGAERGGWVWLARDVRREACTGGGSGRRGGGQGGRECLGGALVCRTAKASEVAAEGGGRRYAARCGAGRGAHTSGGRHSLNWMSRGIWSKRSRPMAGGAALGRRWRWAAPRRSWEISRCVLCAATRRQCVSICCTTLRCSCTHAATRSDERPLSISTRRASRGQRCMTWPCIW